MRRKKASYSDGIGRVHEAYELQIRELRRQQARCKYVAKKVAARHGEARAKRMLAEWAKMLRRQVTD
jgi:uncharacterized protein YqiB (DUF1249 family)